MTDLNPHGLTPVQENVIAAVTGGATMKAAAEAALIHRNTIAYWRRTSDAFRDALGHAQYDKAMFIREEAETHVAEAFDAIHTILTRPDASDTARLNAAKFIIEKATTPPPPKPEVTWRVDPCAQPEIVPNCAQSPEQETAPPAPPEPQKPKIVHSGAQNAPTPFRREMPKVGRNELCPCGSRMKFKRCCLGKPQNTMAA
jgi:hypothetical protein